MPDKPILTSMSEGDTASQSDTRLQSPEVAASWLAAIIESADDAIIGKTLEGIITNWNEGAERVFGYASEEVIGKPVSILIPPGHEDEEPSILAKLRRGERIDHYETIRVRKDGTSINISLTVSPIRGPGGQIIGASKVARDITERKRAEMLVEGQRQILELIVRGASLTEILEVLARVIEGQSSTGGLVSLLLVDGVHLRHGAAPSLPEEYNRAVDGAPVAPEGGSCVAAAFRKEPVISTDIATDPVWAPYRDLALAHGLRACWSTPIISSSDDVLGTLAVYHREPREPNPRDLRLIELMTRTAAIAIERERFEQARREGEEQYRLLFENSRDALLIADDAGNYLRANQAASELLGYTSGQLSGMNVSDLMTGDSPGGAAGRYEAYVRTGYEAGEFSFVRPDGERRTAEYVANRLAPGMHLSVLRDVTERNLIEAERDLLRKGERAARTDAERQRDFSGLILNHAPVAIGVLEGPDHRFVLVNQETCALVGLPQEEFLGRPHAEALPDADEVVGPILDRVYETGVAETREVEVELPTGRRYLLVTWTALPGFDGRPGSVLYLSLDVSETKRAEVERERLLSSEQSARGAAEASLRSQRHIEERLMLLVEASAVLLGSPTLESVQPAVLDLSRRLIAADAYAIWRLNTDAGSWNIVYQDGMSPRYDKESVEDMENTAVLLAGPFMAEDVAQEASLAARQEMYEAEGIKSLLAVPLRIHGAISGTLTFYYRQPHRFDETEVRLATTLANLAGAAISSAELYEEQSRMRTEAEDAERRAHFLAEASRVLASTLDYQTTLAQVAQLAVPSLADWCAVDMAGNEGAIVRLAVAHADPAKVQWAGELATRYPVDLNATNGVPNVLRTGKSELYPHIHDEMLVAGAKDEEHLHIMREIGFVSAMVVPLHVQGKVLGTITFVTSESGRHYGPSDLAFAEDLARRAAAAIDNARLYHSAQEARRTAEQSNRLKDEFLATVSHELRTPLTAMLGWTHLLRSGQLDEQAAERALETVERNARSQNQLIEDLLDVSRIITGKLRLDVRPVDPGSIIDSAIEAVRPAAEAKGIRLQKVMDTGVSAISGDSARLQQVVWNLLSNAIKFTPRGGRVQVRLERINSHIEIAVTDSGEGIKAEFLPYVFDRFRQADGTTTRQHGGLGLGLAIVRHLVELHGGTAEASSHGEGQGATFTVKLPLMPIYRREARAEERVHPTAKDNNPAVECPDDLEGLNILVVDDEADTLELIRVSLLQCGAEVMTAQSVADALTLMGGTLPDVIISDIGMPGEDGYEFIQKIRRLPPELGGKIPAVALTAYARAEDRLRVLRSGYQMHVAKPVELAELIAILVNLVGRTRGGSA